MNALFQVSSHHMNTTIVSALLVLLTQSIYAGTTVLIETKVIESSVNQIPHDLAKAANLKGTDLLSAPSVTVESQNEGKVEIVRQFQPPGIASSKFPQVPIGVTAVVTPRLQDGKVTFTATFTLSELVGETSKKDQTQAEVISRTIFVSGIQEEGEEGWFDLIDPKEGKGGKKLAVWFRFNGQRPD